MAELTHDPAEDGFHEIHLSGKQLLFLFMTGTIVLVFVFLCGVLVGRNAREAGPTQATAFAAGPAETPAAMMPEQVVEPPTPAETVDELSYHQRLQGEDAPAPPPEAVREAPAVPAPRAEPAPAAQKPEPAARTPEPRAEPKAAAPAIPADVPTSGRPGRHAVQVFASSDAQAAIALTKRLIGRGYPAFLVPPAAGVRPPMYRVQVGRYNDRREAEEVSRRLQKEEQFKPWISSR